MTPTGSALARQSRGAFAGLRDIIAKLPGDEWYVGATRDQIPARRADHAIVTARRHCRLPCSYRAPRRDDTADAPWRCPEDMLAYLDDTARQVEAVLEDTTDEQFATPTRRFESGLEHWLYALRHLQHHVGQLSSTLRERRRPPMKWH
jgi:hypothetical protein